MDELIRINQSDVVGRLAFKYMEMCKVDSSSDSDSETNPRWSDVNNKGLKNWEACKKLQRLSGQIYQQCVDQDPYDGSSEDSSSSANKGPKRQRHGGFRVKGRGRRSAVIAPCHRELTDVQMRSSSDSEPGLCSPCRAVSRLKVELSDSGFNTRSSLNSPAVPSGTETTWRSSRRIQLESSTLSPRFPDSPSFHGAFSKRKFLPPSGDADEGMQRKRPCISDMEVERE